MTPFVYIVYDFLFNSNYGSILHRFWCTCIWYQNNAATLKVGSTSFKVIKTGTIR